MIAAPEGSRLDAQLVRDGEVEEFEKIERSVFFDMDRIQPAVLAVRPLASSYLEQGMASDNPSNVEVPREKEFDLFRLGQATQYGRYKWCKIFGVMTKARRREGQQTRTAQTSILSYTNSRYKS
jgi:hypothetical protein